MTLKETALFISGGAEKWLYSIERKLSRDPEAADFLFRERFVVKTGAEELRLELLKRKVDVYFGLGRFLDPHRIEVNGKQSCILYGEHILLATGSYPAHPPGIPSDGKTIHDSDTILHIRRIPRSLCVVGAGVIGYEYATTFAVMGCKVTLVNSHRAILPFLDREIAGALREHFRKLGIEVLTEIRNQSGAHVYRWWRVLLRVATSSVGLVYNLRVVFTLYYEVPAAAVDVGLAALSFPGGCVLGVLAFLLLWLGIYPTPLLKFPQTALSVSCDVVEECASGVDWGCPNYQELHV